MLPPSRFRDPVPSREQPGYQGKRGSGGTHPVRDQPSRRISPARTAFGMSHHWMAAIVTAGGGPEASGRMPEILGRAAAAGAGTGSRFFGERQDDGDGGGWMSWHIIHPIAIRKSVPAPEGIVAGRVPGAVATRFFGRRRSGVHRDGSRRRLAQNDRQGGAAPGRERGGASAGRGCDQILRSAPRRCAPGRLATAPRSE